MKDDFTDINVIPLVDIMLVLITIVLITANFIATGQIPVNLPDSQTASVSSEDEPFIIILNAEGLYYIGEKQVDLTGLKTEIVDRSKDTHIVIRADKEATIQPFVNAVDLIKDTGFTKISIQTKK